MTDSLSPADLAASLITLYFSQSPTRLSGYALDSYNYFVTKELPELIFNQNPITILKEPLGSRDDVNRQYAFKTEIFIGDQVDKPESLGIQFAPPIITLDGGKTVRKMFPMEARLRNLSYSVTVLVDLRIRVTYTRLQPGTGVGGITAVYIPTEILNEKKVGVELFQLPIMLRSVLCATNTTEMPRLASLGECKYDQGGYFIVDGAEKVLITNEETAFNSIYAGKKPNSDMKISSFATCSSLNPKNKEIRRTALYIQRATGAIRVSVPFIRGAIPLFVVFRALGIQSDKDIIQMIIPDLESDEMKHMESILIACVHDAFPITDTYLALQFMRTLTKGFLDETVLDILINNVFMHVPGGFHAKAQFLGEMTRQLIRVEIGLEANTDRDDIRNKRYLTAGTLIRELFTASWKQWTKSLILTIDKEYNYNTNLYSGENFVSIFSDGNLPRMLSGALLNDGLVRGFRGKWGTDSTNERKGVCQPLARISYLDSMSQIRRVSLDFELKSPGPRRLHPSQCGYFCISEVPSGFSIGITKNASIMTIFSLAESTGSLMKWLLLKGSVVGVEKASIFKRKHYCRIQINGGTLGFIRDPEQLVTVLKLFKRTGCTGPTTSISFNRTTKTIRIFMDEGRPCRPLWILRNGILSPLAGRLGDPEIRWPQLVKGVLAEMRGKEFFEPGFTDPFVEEKTMEGYISRLEPFAGALEYIDPYESNESFVAWWGSSEARDIKIEHTHCEIHPSTMFGFVGNMIPFANHNQSPRNQLSCSQSKQGIGFYSTQFANRFDTYGTQMCYAEAPITRTLYYDLIADGNMGYGVNVTVALASFDGYNMDDGILFNASSIERGLFHHLSFKTYDALEEKDQESKNITRIGNPAKITNWLSLRPGVDYSKLDEDGIIKEGSIVDPATVLVGRYTTFPETGQIKDASVTPQVFTTGRVEKVSVIHQANGYRLVHVRIFELRVPELGDKFSNRHGQKGTIGMIRPCYDLPRTATGLVPDVLVNPHSIPSRMTIAQILEQITSKAGAIYGAKMNATSFANDDKHVDIMGNALEEAGFDRNGEEIMFSPFTGKQYTTTIFSCPQYLMRLRHLVKDKMNSRGVGRKEQRTHQPTGGRGNEGGLRIGEMERDVLIAHGSSAMLHERMMKCSDETEFFLCNSCGQMPIYNEAERIYVCPVCDGPIEFVGKTEDTIEMIKPIARTRTTFSKVKMPYAFKLLNQELATYMNLGMRFVSEKIASRLKDESWDWASIAGLTDAGDDTENMDLIPLPEFNPIELPVSEAVSVESSSGIRLEVIKEELAEEAPVEPLPPNPLLEAERKRADDAEAILAEMTEQSDLSEGPGLVQIQLPTENGGERIRQRGGSPYVIVLPQIQGSSAHKNHNPRGPYIPKLKGAALRRMYEDQEGGETQRQQEEKETVEETEQGIGAGSQSKGGNGPIQVNIVKLDSE
jgi:DNA-directed RNA polymerase II subunit RPB2